MEGVMKFQFRTKYNDTENVNYSRYKNKKQTNISFYRAQGRWNNSFLSK